MSVPDKSPADRELGLQMLQAAMQTAVGAIIIIDDKGIIASVNPAAERVFGFPEVELIGQNVNMLMPEPYRSRHDGYIRHHLETGEKKIIGIGRQVMGRRKSGAIFPLHLSVSAFEAEGRRYFTGIVLDLADQRHTDVAARAGAVPGDLQSSRGRGAGARRRQHHHALQPRRDSRVRLRARGADRQADERALRQRRGIPAGAHAQGALAGADRGRRRAARRSLPPQVRRGVSRRGRHLGAPRPAGAVHRLRAAQPRHQPAGRAGRGAAQIAAHGGDRPAHRRHRPRLQQPAHHHHRQPRAAGDGARRSPSRRTC